MLKNWRIAPTLAVVRTLVPALLLAAMAARSIAAETVGLHGRTMGTTYNVKYWTEAATAPAPPDVQRRIDRLLTRIDRQMSTWRPDSELSRFNAANEGEWLEASHDVVVVVARALELHEQTKGASDVTVGPVLRLWGFGAGANRLALDSAKSPSADALSAARRRVGANHLEVRRDPPALRKNAAGIEIDLSSIAPGYAVDRIVDVLAAEHIDNAMVDLGGEVRGVGVRPDGKAWQIGVEAPPPNERTVSRVIPLANLAVATSGDFHNVRTIDGQRYTHIIDPRSGRPVPYRGASVTVVAETCFAADGVATALFVMGPKAGRAWCVAHGVAAMFQEPGVDGGRAKILTTPRFDELVPALSR